MGFRKILIGVAAAVALLGVWAFGIEPRWTRFRDTDIHLPGWPRAASGFTIAFLSDTHVGGMHVSRDKMKAIVAAVNARKPDLILLGGDYVTSTAYSEHVPSNEIAAILSRLHAPHGVYGVLGNHDNWENGPRICAEFEKAGIPMLEDEARHIAVGNSAFWLIGISDDWTGPRDFTKAFASVDFGQAVIAFTHSPDRFPQLPDGVGLTLAGHTHGGQVYIPFVGRPVVPSKYGEHYAIGLIREGNRQLFVSPGIGTSMVPVRFLTPPEVSFLHLYP